MKRSVKGMAVIIAGMTFSALGCASSGTGLWNPMSHLSPKKYSDDTRFKIARIQEQENKLGKARGLYEELYRDDSKNADVCHRLAIVSARLNDDQSADRYFREAIELAPERSDLLADYGYALFRRNDMKGAERWLKQALTVEPANKRAANNLAIVLGHQGRAEESLAAFRRVVGEAEAQANLAYIHVQRGEGRMAVERYNRALAIDKNLHKATHALLQLAKLEQRYLQTEKAKRLIAQAKARKAKTSEESVQLVGATEPKDQPAATIQQANFEGISQSPKPTTPKQMVKPADYREPAAEPVKSSKTPDTKTTGMPRKPAKTAAAPFPQVGSPKPVAPAVPSTSGVQQVNHNTTETTTKTDTHRSEAFKLSTQPQVKQDPAFSTPTAKVAPSISEKPKVNTATETAPAKLTSEKPETAWIQSNRVGRITTGLPDGDKIAEQSADHRVPPMQSPQPKFNQDPKPLENPFETLERETELSNPPARVVVRRGQNDRPARISIAPKTARVRLTPQAE